MKECTPINRIQYLFMNFYIQFTPMHFFWKHVSDKLSPYKIHKDQQFISSPLHFVYGKNVRVLICLKIKNTYKISVDCLIVERLPMYHRSNIKIHAFLQLRMVRLYENHICIEWYSNQYGEWWIPVIVGFVY